MKSEYEQIMDKFAAINERPVDNISMELFYKPRTISLFIVSFFSLMYFSLIRSVIFLY